MANISNDMQAIERLLREAKVIALVGYSDKPDRDSYRVGAYLRAAGYTVYPVNPTVDEIDGHKSYPTLAEVPEPIDIVDVFRGVRHLPPLTRQAVDVGAKAVWGQLEIAHTEAEAIAAAAGIDLVMNRCIKIEHTRLGIGG